jgi:hypothetical protein
MFVEVYRSGRMGYAFTDVSAFADACAVSGERAVTDVRRPENAPYSGRPVRRNP